MPGAWSSSPATGLAWWFLPLPSPRSVICWPIRSGADGAGLAAEFCAAIADDELRVIEATPHDYRRMAELLTT